MVAAATEAAEAVRGDPEAIKRVLDRSPVPMLLVDDRRRYVEVNRPARLAFRLSLAELRKSRIEDLTPPHGLPLMEAIWAQLHEAGCVAGDSFEVDTPGGRFHVVYVGL